MSLASREKSIISGPIDASNEIGSDLQATIDRLQKQLSQAQRLATIGELTSTTTHEFNNLLMTIMNYAKLGIRHKDDATRDKALSKILDAANRAAKVTQTILGLARNRSGEREPTDLTAVVRDTLVLLEREMVRYRISLETELEPTPPAIAEGNQIQRVLINLLTNARQAIGESGTIKIRLSYDHEHRQVVLMVRDSGNGIPPESLPRIFEPFYSTKQGPMPAAKEEPGSVCRHVAKSSKSIKERFALKAALVKEPPFTFDFRPIRMPCSGSRRSAHTIDITRPSSPSWRSFVSKIG